MPNRWFILLILFAARLSLGLAFQSAGSAAPFLIEAFAVGLTEIGTLVGLFMIPGIVLAIPAGMLGARFGDKRMVLIGLALMAVGILASGFATDWSLMLAGRALNGIGAVSLLVLMVKMVFDWFVGRELFVAMSIFIIGWPVGHAAGQYALTSIAAEAGWPIAFHLAALACGAALLLMTALYRSPPDAKGRVQGLLTAMNGREFWLVSIAAALWMLANGGYIVILGFGPEFLMERGATETEAAAAASLMPWAFFVGLPLGGWVATRWQIPNLVMIVSFFFSTLFCAVLVAGGPGALFFPLGLAMAFGTAAMSAMPSEVLRESVRAAGLGFYYIWYFTGSAAFPVIAGALSDGYATANAAMVLATAMLAFSLFLLFAFRVEQRRFGVAPTPTA